MTAAPLCAAACCRSPPTPTSVLPRAAWCIEDATLRTTADMSSARAVELAGTHGTIETLGGTSLTLSGTVSGAGSLVKEGAGTLVLNGTNSYTGNTFVRPERWSAISPAFAAT